MPAHLTTICEPSTKGKLNGKPCRKTAPFVYAILQTVCVFLNQAARVATQGIRQKVALATSFSLNRTVQENACLCRTTSTPRRQRRSRLRPAQYVGLFARQSNMRQLRTKRLKAPRDAAEKPCPWRRYATRLIHYCGEKNVGVFATVEQAVVFDGVRVVGRQLSQAAVPAGGGTMS